MFREEVKARLAGRTVQEIGVLDVNGLKTSMIADRMLCVQKDIANAQEPHRRRILAEFQLADPLRAFRRLSELSRAGGLDREQQQRLAVIRHNLVYSLGYLSDNPSFAYKWMVENEGVKLLLEEISRKRTGKESNSAEMSDDDISAILAIIFIAASNDSLRDGIKTQMNALLSNVSRCDAFQIDRVEMKKIVSHIRTYRYLR